jgi:hypothetical protein
MADNDGTSGAGTGGQGTGDGTQGTPPPAQQTQGNQGTGDGTQGTPPPDENALGDAGKAALALERAARRDADKRATDLQAELDKVRRQTMTDSERAVAEARDAARTETMSEFGAKLVAAEFKMKAAGRIGEAQLTTLMSGLNLAGFLTPQGDPDEAKIQAFIDGVAPAGGAGADQSQSNDSGDLGWLVDRTGKGAADEQRQQFPNIGQGAQGTPPALNDDPLLKALVGKVGDRSRQH